MTEHIAFMVTIQHTNSSELKTIFLPSTMREIENALKDMGYTGVYDKFGMNVNSPLPVEIHTLADHANIEQLNRLAVVLHVLPDDEAREVLQHGVIYAMIKDCERRVFDTPDIIRHRQQQRPHTKKNEGKENPEPGER
ncbi:hypothetical protein LJC32_01200 [Oscillospiraceae bacterium OttesenSCG-928-F05]|nr:hypothetical protein [Oscillospiraceae bacterium OttesenSCG-928-F05]